MKEQVKTLAELEEAAKQRRSIRLSGEHRSSPASYYFRMRCNVVAGYIRNRGLFIVVRKNEDVVNGSIVERDLP